MLAGSTREIMMGALSADWQTLSAIEIERTPVVKKRKLEAATECCDAAKEDDERKARKLSAMTLSAQRESKTFVLAYMGAPPEKLFEHPPLSDLVRRVRYVAITNVGGVETADKSKAIAPSSNGSWYLICLRIHSRRHRPSHLKKVCINKVELKRHIKNTGMARLSDEAFPPSSKDEKGKRDQTLSKIQIMGRYHHGILIKTLEADEEERNLYHCVLYRIHRHHGMKELNLHAKSDAVGGEEGRGEKDREVNEDEVVPAKTEACADAVKRLWNVQRAQMRLRGRRFGVLLSPVDENQEAQLKAADEWISKLPKCKGRVERFSLKEEQHAIATQSLTLMKDHQCLLIVLGKLPPTTTPQRIVDSYKREFAGEDEPIIVYGQELRRVEDLVKSLRRGERCGA